MGLQGRGWTATTRTGWRLHTESTPDELLDGDRAGLSGCFDALADYCSRSCPTGRASPAAVQHPTTGTQLERQDRRLDRGISTTLRRRGLVVAPAGTRGSAEPVRALRVHPGRATGEVYPLSRAAWTSGRPLITTTSRRVGSVTRGPDRRQRLVARAGPLDARHHVPKSWCEHVRQLPTATSSSEDTATQDIDALRARLYLPWSAHDRLAGGVDVADNLGETTHRHLSPLMVSSGDRIRRTAPRRRTSSPRRRSHRAGMDSFGWANACAAVLVQAEGRGEGVQLVVRT